MTEQEIREKIIGCAFHVHNVLGLGFVEKVYENALCVELRRSGLRVETQTPIRVCYQGEVVGEFVADMVVENTILLELKAVRALAQEHEVQLVNYLTATGMDSGLLINFGQRVEVKRKFRVYRGGNPVHPENPVNPV